MENINYFETNTQSKETFNRDLAQALQQNDFDLAEKLCFRELDARNVSDLLFKIADISEKKGNLDLAIKYWASNRLFFPKRSACYYKPGYIYLKQKKFDKAHDLGSEGIAQLPKSPESYVLLAEIEMARKDWSSALKCWEKVRTLFPDRLASYHRAAIASIHLGNLNQARNFCIDGLKINDSSPELLNCLADVEDKVGNTPLAKLILEKTIKIRDDYTISYKRLINILVREQQLNDAIKVCYNALEHCKYDITFNLILCDIFHKKGNFIELLEHIKTLILQNPHNDQILNSVRKYYKDTTIPRNIGIEFYENIIRSQKLKNFSFYSDLYILYEKEVVSLEKKINLIEKAISQFGKNFQDPRLSWMIGKACTEFFSKNEKLTISTTVRTFLINLLQQNYNLSNKGYLEITRLLRTICRSDPNKSSSLFDAINEIIQKEKLTSPVISLISKSSEDQTIIRAIEQLSDKGCTNIIELYTQFCSGKHLLQKALKTLINNENYKKYNPHDFYIFARTVNFIDQNLSDNIISQWIDFRQTNSDIQSLLQLKINSRKNLLSNISTNCQTKRKFRIALCVSGQLRGYKEAFESWKSFFDFNNNDIDIYVHTWNKVGTKFPFVAHADRVFQGKFLRTYRDLLSPYGTGEDFVKKFYPKLYSLISNQKSVTEDEIRKFYNAKSVVVENEELFGLDRTSTEKMHYKIEQCYLLTKESNEVYDLIVRIRPDLIIENSAKIDFNDLYHQSKSLATIFVRRPWLPDFLSNKSPIEANKENLELYIQNGWAPVPGGFCGYTIDDMFSIGTNETMSIYSTTYSRMKEFWDKKSPFSPSEYKGHFCLDHVLYTNGIHVSMLDMGTRLSDKGIISPNLILNALKKDQELRDPLPSDKPLIEACEFDCINLKHKLYQ